MQLLEWPGERGGLGSWLCVRFDFSQPKYEKAPGILRRQGRRHEALCSVLVHPEGGRALAEADAALWREGLGELTKVKPSSSRDKVMASLADADRVNYQCLRIRSALSLLWL